MDLNPSQRRRFLTLLGTAFPTWTALARMVDEKLDQSLEGIAGTGRLEDITFNLLQWARAHGKIEALVRGACDERLDLPGLQDFCRELGLTPAVPPPPDGKRGGLDASPLTERELQELGPIRDRWAVLVGINRYSYPEAYPALSYCVADVQALAAKLTALGYTVVSLTYPNPARDQWDPTRINILTQLARVCKTAAQEDLVWVHFSCHGQLVDGAARLIARDTSPDLVRDTSIPLADVQQMLQTSAARRQVITLDACHAGLKLGRAVNDAAFIRNVFDLAEGFALIAASTADQLAQESGEAGHGIFTHYLLQGLGGEADGANPKKNFVTVSDLRNYVLDQLRRWAIANGALIQTPTATLATVGDLILADYRTPARP